MQITIGDYVIRPYQNGLCWTIDKMAEVKKRDGTVERELVSAKRFPTSLQSAINMVCEMMMLDDAKEVVGNIGDVADAIGDLKKEVMAKITIVTATNRKRR